MISWSKINKKNRGEMCNESKNRKKRVAKLFTMSYNDICRVAKATKYHLVLTGTEGLGKITYEIQTKP